MRRGGSVHVATIRTKGKDRVYVSYLLRRSYREGGKVRHENFGNLSHLPEATIELVRRSLAGETFLSTQEDFSVARSLPHGHVAAVLGVLRALDLERLVGRERCRERCRERDLVVAMIVQRLIASGSKLSATRRFAQTTLGDELGLGEVKEADLMGALDWLVERHDASSARSLVVTSPRRDLCSMTCPQATSRAGAVRWTRWATRVMVKRGKAQITYGLTCCPQGRPVAVEVHPGNTQDQTTLIAAVDAVRQRFGIERVVVVGDRGMITQAHARDLKAQGVDFISALKAPQVKALAASGELQLSRFDQTNLAEISSEQFPGRLRCADAGTIGQRAGRVVNKYKMAKHFDLQISDGAFSFSRNQQQINAEGALDRPPTPRPHAGSRRLKDENFRLASISTMTPDRVVVYTAIAGSIDGLREPLFVSPGVDHICFTDDRHVTSRHWQFRPFDEVFHDPTRTAKKPKVLPHRYFSEYDVSVWIDGNQTLVGDIATLAANHLSAHSLAMFGHPDGRSCVYDEAEVCISLKKDDPSVIRRQVERYRAVGYPPQNGMPTCGVLLRRHNDPQLVEAMEAWWREISAGSRRDQISFPFVAWQHGLGYAPVPGNLRYNPVLTWRPHSGFPTAKVRRPPPDQTTGAQTDRSDIYGPQFFSARDQARRSAEVLVPLVIDLVGPRSVVDVGCGDGVWLEGFRNRGLEVLGLDGEWARAHLTMPADYFQTADLAQPFKLGRAFDLAISLEVAEHLPPDSSEGFVASLTRAAPTILFSAAIPGQKGTHHINLQWPKYWVDLFAQHGFVVIDCLRSRVWSDKRVSGPYSQNAMFFVDRDRLARLPALEREAAGGFANPPSLVHPDIFRTALNSAERRGRRALDDGRAASGPELERTIRKLHRDLHKSTGRERKLERRLVALEARLAHRQRSRWLRLGRYLAHARMRLEGHRRPR